MEFRSKPFDVETTFANVVLSKNKRTTKFRGPDSPLYSTIYPAFFIVKVFGLAPYDFARDQLTPSNLYLIFSLIWMGIYTYNVCAVFMRFVMMEREQPVLGGTEGTKLAVNYVVAMYEILLTVFTRETFVRIWNAFQDYDESVKLLGYPRKETRTGIFTWIVMITQTMIWLAINRSGMYAFMETWKFNVTYMSVYVGTSVSLHKFVGMAFFLGQRFQQLNEIARKNLPPRSGYRAAVVSKKTIQDLHNELMLAGETLNSLYSWSLLVWLGNLSIHIVNNMYFIMSGGFLSNWTVIQWPLILCLSAWLTAFIAQLLVLHIACDYTSTQANSMGAILIEWNAKLMKKSPPDDTFGISLHFLNRRLNFSAGGVFDVNLSLLSSIVGVLSTYLVILLQLPE